MSTDAAMASAVEGMRALITAEFGENAAFKQMVAAYGGDPRCYERFLIVCSLDVPTAAVRFKETLAFRQQHGLEAGLDTWPDPAILEKVKPHWPGRFPGNTNDGSPIQVFPVGNLDASALMAALSEDELRHYYLWWMETTLQKQNDANPTGTRSSDWKGQIEIYDFTGLSIWQVSPFGLRMLGRVLSIGGTHYPDCLRKTYIINVPYGMSSAWSLVSSFLSAEIVSKVSIDNDTKELEALLPPELKLSQLSAGAS